MNLYGPVKVGGDCLAYCGKCKRESAHVIMSMVDRKPARVICKTCQSQHNYRSESLKTVKSRSSSLPKAPRTFVKNSEYWETKLAARKSNQTKPYKPQESFLKGDVIQHAKFGLGIVEEIITPSKILVLFRDEERTLVQNHT